ncbi:hypothetical protein KO361_04600 [Candidatus Woesearchaeota archaeon]|nr:hypothetical protein [Candidatus Woesearchaeota archaeon]
MVDELDFKPFLRNLYDLLPSESSNGSNGSSESVNVSGVSKMSGSGLSGDSGSDGSGVFSDEFWDEFWVEQGFEESKSSSDVLEGEPYFDLYRRIVEVEGLSSRADLRRVRKIAKHRFMVESSSGVLRAWYEARNWVYATMVVGMADDETASKLAPYTGYSKKYCQDWNAPLSMLDHGLFVCGGAETAMNSSSYGDFVSNFGLWSLVVTTPMALGNLVWNSYRLYNRDEKARPAFGYAGLVLNGFFYLKKNHGSWFSEKFSLFKERVSDAKSFIRGSVLGDFSLRPYSFSEVLVSDDSAKDYNLERLINRDFQNQ